jgi:hypothetical protein
MLDAFVCVAARTTGSRSTPSGRWPHRETLFKIGFDDGTAYARAGRQEADATGTTPEVFEFDVDGTLVAEAEQRHTHS